MCRLLQPSFLACDKHTFSLSHHKNCKSKAYDISPHSSSLPANPPVRLLNADSPQTQQQYTNTLKQESMNLITKWKRGGDDLEQFQALPSMAVLVSKIETKSY